MTSLKILLALGLFTFCNCVHIPPHTKLALMARYVVHNSDWASISTISTLKSIQGYPFVNLKSISDGPLQNGKGIIYFYLSKLDLSVQDIAVNNRVTVMTTLAQSEYCKSENLDPQDPRCARVLMSGKIEKVDKKDADYNFAHNALITRHPDMKYWDKVHEFFVAKLNMEQIAVLDFFGGVKYVTIDDYLNANTTIDHHKFYEIFYLRVLHV